MRTRHSCTKGFLPPPPFQLCDIENSESFSKNISRSSQIYTKIFTRFFKNFTVFFAEKMRNFVPKKLTYNMSARTWKLAPLYKQLEVEPFDMLHSFSDTWFFFSNWQMNALLSKQSPKATTLTLLSMFEVFFFFSYRMSFNYTSKDESFFYLKYSNQ